MCLPESDRRSEDEWLAGSPDQMEAEEAEEAEEELIEWMWARMMRQESVIERQERLIRRLEEDKERLGQIVVLGFSSVESFHFDTQTYRLVL